MCVFPGAPPVPDVASQHTLAAAACQLCCDCCGSSQEEEEITREEGIVGKEESGGGLGAAVTVSGRPALSAGCV